ncbi:conserved hypothetical protein [Frankia sp. Hr75.2]|nr:conserved hypothetical protein [Frankia sp. Hr75.2]
MAALVVSADGKMESLTPINPRGEPRFTAFAVSPDGSRLALDGMVAGTTGLTAGITIVNVNSGETQTFRNKPSDQDGIWILDTSQGSSDLRASSHRVTSGAQPAFEAMSELTLNANSTRVYAVVTRRGQNPYLTKRVIELDAATGRQLRVLLELSHDYSLTTGWNASSLALDPSGQLLMVSDAGADYYRVDLGSGQTSRLPTAVNRGNPNGLAW